jgi:hypothetical protein
VPSPDGLNLLLAIVIVGVTLYLRGARIAAGMTAVAAIGILPFTFGKMPQPFPIEGISAIRRDVAAIRSVIPPTVGELQRSLENDISSVREEIAAIRSVIPPTVGELQKNLQNVREETAAIRSLILARSYPQVVISRAWMDPHGASRMYLVLENVGDVSFFKISGNVLFCAAETKISLMRSPAPMSAG